MGGYALYDQARGGTTAPDFTLTSTGYENRTMGDPVEFSLSDRRGSVVVLDFMAVSCTSCRILTAEVLEPLQEEYGHREDFVIWSIDVWADPDSKNFAVGETEERLIRLQKEENVTWRHALDTDQVWQKYNAFALPKLVVVDPEGQVVYAANGIPGKDEVASRIDAAYGSGAEGVPLLELGVFGFAALAGVLSFFAPCSVGLIPAYLGFLMQGRPGPAAERVRRTLWGGAAAAGGVVALYAAIALLLIPFGPSIQEHLERVGPVMGALLVLLGLLMLAGASWDRFTQGIRIDGRRGFFAFGVGYGLAAFGCVGPALLPVLVLGFGQGLLQGSLVFLVYALVVAALMVYAAALVAAGRAGRLRRVLERKALVQRTSALLMVAGGAFVLWFYVRAGALL